MLCWDARQSGCPGFIQWMVVLAEHVVERILLTTRLRIFRCLVGWSSPLASPEDFKGSHWSQCFLLDGDMGVENGILAWLDNKGMQSMATSVSHNFGGIICPRMPVTVRRILSLFMLELGNVDSPKHKDWGMAPYPTLPLLLPIMLDDHASRCCRW